MGIESWCRPASPDSRAWSGSHGSQQRLPGQPEGSSSPIHPISVSRCSRHRQPQSAALHLARSCQEIDTLVGQGTTMRLRLPARRSAEEIPAVAAPRPQARRSLRVLVVDDEPMMRQVVTKFLELDEHVVEVAASGRDAMTKLQVSAAFDLIITDRAMPEMGGDELAAMVKVLAPNTPVMMLTGFADLMEAADQRPAGVDLVVGKPTTLARLRAAIVTLIPDPDEAAAPSYDINAQ
jgi:CheY-like chemotaxis protein